jgi:hypothetical protein
LFVLLFCIWEQVRGLVGISLDREESKADGGNQEKAGEQRLAWAGNKVEIRM